MLIVEGRELGRMDAAGFEGVAAAYARVAVDIGTGDGLFVYHLAARDPDTLYVGCDPAAANMLAASQRSRRKPARGGVPNVLYVVASAEDPPGPLRGRAAEVFCVLPWGRLLEGIMTGDPEILGGLRGVAAPGAPIHIYLNAGVWDRSTPRQVEDLPPATPEHVDGVLVPAYARAGIHLVEHGAAPPGEVRALRSTWAGRLTHGGGGRFVRLEGRAVVPAGRPR